MMRSGSFSSRSGGPMTPSGMGGGALSTPATPLSTPFAKRASVFTGQAVVPSTIQLLQKTLFSKLHEEVLALLQVIPRKNEQSNSAADEQAYFLVLTLNSQIKKSVDGFGAPKLHWVKIKSPEAGSGVPGGGEVSYTHKKFKLLKLLKRIDIPPSGGGAATGTASGSLRKREEFTLVFTSGNTDKLYTFGMKAGAGGGGSQPSTPAVGAGAGAGVGVTSNPDRAVFIWYCLEICRIYCGFVPTSNIDTVLYQQLTNEITAYYLQPGAPGTGGAPPGAGLSAQHKELMVAVSKNRHNALENDTRSLDRINIEEKVIVPSMTAEETKLVQLFLKQIDHTPVKPGGSPTSGASTSFSLGGIGGASHSNINELESYLLHKLSQIESANIESLFDPVLEAANARILRDDIQTNLLDNKLEEMSLWINHHNGELTKMKKGIEQIEKRNLSLDIQEKNQTALHQTLHLVLDSLQLDDEEDESAGAGSVEYLLEHPDFSTGRLERTLGAARRLDHILHLSIEDGKLEELRAVKEQRLKYEGVRRKFTKQAAAAIEGVFQETAKKAVHELSRDADSSLSLSTNGSIHRDLRRYLELLRYLERLELDLFVALRTAYCAYFRGVYEAKFKGYFHQIKRAVAQEQKDTRMISFPDWSADMLPQISRVRSEQGRSVSVSQNGAIASLLKSGPNAGPPPSQTGKLLATQAFVQALKNVSPLCVSEEKFLHEYFGLTPDSVLHGSGGGSSVPSGGVGGAPKDSSTRTAALKSDSDELKNMMVDLFRGLEHDLREVSVNGSKMDHFYTLEMLVQCEKIMQESSAAAAAAAAASAAAATAAAAASAAAAAASAAANSSGGGSPSSTSSSISLFTPLPTPSGSAASSASSTASSPAGSGSTPPGSEYLISIVTALSTHLKLSFNQFVDGEIEWLNGLKPNPKRCGILQPFAKFPALVDRMENVVRSGAGAAAALSPTSKSGSASSATAAAAAAAAASQARSQAADTSYQKLASALFRWLDGVAKSDDKYTDVVVMENAHHYHTMFSSPFLSVPALEQSVAKAGAAYREHMARYVAWNIAYEMPAVTKFWARIEDQLKSILPEEIPFASELSKHDLRALNKGPLSAKPLQKSLTNVLKRVEKHMPKNTAMINVVWSQIGATFLAKFDRFEALVADCYQNEKLSITREEVVAMFQQLLPAAAPGTVTGTGRSSASVSVESSRNR